MPSAAPERSPSPSSLYERLDHATGGHASFASAVFVVCTVTSILGVLLTMIDHRSGIAVLDDPVARWSAEQAASTAVDAFKLLTHLGSRPIVFIALATVAAYDFSRRRHVGVFLFRRTRRDR